MHPPTSEVPEGGGDGAGPDLLSASGPRPALPGQDHGRPDRECERLAPTPPMAPTVASQGLPRPARDRLRPPLIALAAVVVVGVVGAAVLTLIGATTGGSDPSRIDTCLVGEWRVTTYAENVAVSDVGSVQFRGSEPGARMRLGPDGKGVLEYGNGTAFASSLTITGQQVGIDLVLTGTVTYDFRTNGGLMSFTNVKANGTTTIMTTTGARHSEPLRGSADPAQYACTGDALTTYTAGYRAELTRA